MALPTAPLGQLPSMNMPYNIPTYEKGPSIWEKALASFLVNAAGGIAQQGAENVMARDHASEFGEKNATGFSRLLGPKVGDKEAEQRRAQTFAAGESAKGRTFSADQAELSRLAQAGENDTTAANAGLRQDRQIQAGLDEQLLRDKNALVRDDQTIAAGTAQERLRALLHAQDPGNQAQAKRDIAAAGESDARTAFNRQFLGDGKATTAPVSTHTGSPSVEQFKAGLTPRQQQLQAMLASPAGQQRYRTADSVMASAPSNPPTSMDPFERLTNRISTGNPQPVTPDVQTQPAPAAGPIYGSPTEQEIQAYIDSGGAASGRTLQGYDPNSPLELLRSLVGYRQKTHVGP